LLFLVQRFDDELFFLISADLTIGFIL